MGWGGQGAGGMAGKMERYAVDRGMSFTAKFTSCTAISFPHITTNLDLCNAILDW